MIELLPERCSGCGGCVGSCPVGALSLKGGVVQVSESCTECGVCVPFCPHGALHLPNSARSAWPPLLRAPDSEYDIVVIGGGPAGSTAARAAALAGARVLLLEKRPIVGSPQLCAEGISYTGLTDTIPDVADGWISAPIIGAVLVSPAGRRTVVNHPKAGFVLERRIFDRDLFALAAAAGTRTLTSAEALGPIWKNEEIVGVRFSWMGEERKVACKVIIAADGVECSMARALFPKQTIGPNQIHVAAQAVMSGVDVDVGFPEFYIGREVAPGGYAWVFPKAEPLANVGVGINPSLVGDHSRTAWQFLHEFIERRFGGRGEIVEIASGNVPTAKRLDRIAYKNVLFVGDAGRLTDPLSGGGLASALFSGQLAGKIAVESIQREANIERHLADYSSAWKRSKDKQFALYWKAKSIFARLDDDDLEGVCRFIDDRFGRGSFDSIDIPGTIKALIREKRLFLRLLSLIMTPKN